MKDPKQDFPIFFFINIDKNEGRKFKYTSFLALLLEHIC